MVNIDGLNMATSTCQNSKGINQDRMKHLPLPLLLI